VAIHVLKALSNSMKISGTNERKRHGRGTPCACIYKELNGHLWRKKGRKWCLHGCLCGAML